MKTPLLLIALLLSTSLSAQEPRGVTPIPHSELRIPNSTRAVVIGISDYQDPAIPDLRFADKDAEAFSTWLQSEAGGSQPASRIKLLTNEQAKIGNMVAALTWLLDESKQGDRAIIYFSGHGDVENATMFQRGYLLAYDMPPTNYMAGGINVRDFQDVISTLSNRGVQVIMISDACRAGKLAGSETGGAQATTMALQQQFANEIKILSCQPDEFSVEGEQWGGGRGAFSYHLIDGLYGLADRNADLQVSLLEIGNYLQEIVSAETAPQSQIPFTVGNPKTRLARINEQALATLKKIKAGLAVQLKPIESKGMEDLILAKADTSIQQLYQEFLAAIERGDLMQPVGKSADDYYRRLISEPELAQLHGLMKRNFAAALQNEAQVVTNALLKTDPYAISDAWSRPFAFDHIPAYLSRAAEILGADHFFYKYLKAKQYFFEAKTCLPDKFPDLSPDSVARMAAGKFEAALRFDSSAAYAHVELGFLLWYKLAQFDKALLHAKKALELSPNWVYAHFLAGNCYRLSNSKQAIRHLEKAIELDSTFLLSYQELALQYLISGNRKKQVYYQNQFIEKAKALIALNPEKATVYYQTLLGGELWRASRFKEAEYYLLQAAALSKGQELAVYQYLGALYLRIGRTTDALSAAKRQLELAPYNIEGYSLMAECYTRLNQPLKTVQVLEKAFSTLNLSAYPNAGTLIPWLNTILAEAYKKSGRVEAANLLFQKNLEILPKPITLSDYYIIGRTWLGLGDTTAFQTTIAEGLEKFPDDPIMYFQVACLYSLAEQEQMAIEWLELAIKAGFDDPVWIQNDYDLDFIRNKSGYKALLDQYFPGMIKD